MYGKHDPVTGDYIPPSMELVRLAFPRRVYTQSHFDYVLEAITHVYKHRDALRGYKIMCAPKLLKHFTAKFAKV